MYFVYILKSLKNSKRYIGYSSKNPLIRLSEHNRGKTPYTKNNIPYKLLFYESGYCHECAKRREQFLKSGQGRYFLDLIEIGLNRGSSP